MTRFSEVHDDLRRPVGDAVGLPNACYTSTAVLARENATLFRDHWICVGLAADAAEPGSVHPVTAAGQPLVLVRTQAGALKVFHNVCRHRGTLLVTEPRSGLKAITCPYHAWTYGLDGPLKATPRFDGSNRGAQCALDPLDYGLREVPSGVWNHLVFVNLSAGAPPLERWLAPLAERWRDYPVAETRPGGAARYDIAANWKLVLENFLESYHLPFVHKGLNRYSPLGDHELAVTDLYMGQVSHRYAPQDAAAGRLPGFAGLPEARRAVAEYLLVFPNLMLSCAPDHFRATIVTPVAPDRTLQRWVFFFVAPGAFTEALEPARRALVDRICAVTDEDIAILERLQAGRASEGYDGGRFSPHHERTVHNFQRLVAAHLAGAEQDEL